MKNRDLQRQAAEQQKTIQGSINIGYPLSLSLDVRDVAKTGNNEWRQSRATHGQQRSPTLSTDSACRAVSAVNFDDRQCRVLHAIQRPTLSVVSVGRQC